MRPVYFLLAGVLALCAVSAGAAVVTVTPNPQPSDMPVGGVGLGETTLTNGWSIVTNALGYGKLSTAGPSTYESRTGPWRAEPWFENEYWYPTQNMGRGAFFATCDEFKATAPIMMNDWTPSNVWLGTDTWQGQSVIGKTLGSISAMSYYSFCSRTPTRCFLQEQQRNELGWWGKFNAWNGPQQPIQLQFTIQSPDGSETRQIWYRPWGYNFVGDDGLQEPGSQKGRWQWFNCMKTGPAEQSKWFMPCCGPSPNQLARIWYPDGSIPSWSIMLNDSMPEGGLGQFRDWKLCSTEKSPGWATQTFPTSPYTASTVPVGSVNSNGTGKPVNFFLGARVSKVYQLYDELGESILGTSLFDQGVDLLWTNSTYGVRAQVDYFELGFGYDQDTNPITETYDFEPAPNDPPAHLMYASGKSLDVLRSPLMAASNQWNGNLYKITGKVGTANRQWFELEDGSMLTYRDPGFYPNWTFQTLPGPIRVYLPDDEFWGNPLWIGSPVPQLVSVYGYVEPIRMAWPNPPELGRDPNSTLVIWTNISNLTRDNILDLL